MADSASPPDRGDGLPDLNDAKRLSRAGRQAEAWAIAAERLHHHVAEADSLKVLVKLAEDTGWYSDAFPYLDAAIPGSDPDTATYWRYRGTFLARQAGAVARAKAYLQAVIERDPNAAAAYNEMGLIEKEQGNTEKALAWLATAEEADPDNPSPAYNRGRIMSDRRELTAAVACFRQAVARQPGHLDAHCALVRTLERLNDLDGARAAQAAAEAAVGPSPKLTVMAARLAWRGNDLAAARERLTAVNWQRLDGPTYRDGLFLAGHVFDRLGEPERAMAYFDAGNQALAQSDQAKRYDKTTVQAQLDRLKAGFRAERVTHWPRPGAASADARTPIFLVGFPRSGTTLLEVALGSHPAITVLEERPVVERVTAAIAEKSLGYPETLFWLNADHVEQLRQIYFTHRAAFLAEDESRIVVDKLPLNLQHAGLLYRLFPEATFIFAARHPGDAVLSCFMQAFIPNASMNHFYSLGEATDFYDRLMGLWRQYLAVLPLRVATVPYEALIADFEPVMAQLLSVLGLPWDDAVVHYRERAAADGVDTPSYAQVSQPLYTASRYRWQRYAPWLAASLPTLRSWASWLGYTEHADGSITAPDFHQR